MIPFQIAKLYMFNKHSFPHICYLLPIHFSFLSASFTFKGQKWLNQSPHNWDCASKCDTQKPNQSLIQYNRTTTSFSLSITQNPLPPSQKKMEFSSKPLGKFLQPTLWQSHDSLNNHVDCLNDLMIHVISYMLLILRTATPHIRSTNPVRRNTSSK